jgi:hypothetical protein
MSDLQVPTLSVGAEFVDEANAAVSNLLTVPEYVDNPAKAKVFFNELMEINKSEIQAVAGDVPGRSAVRVWFTILPESPDQTNVGRTWFMSALLNIDSLKSKDAALAGERTMTIMSMGRLNALIRALGHEAGGTNLTYNDYFAVAPDGTEPPVLGGQVVTTIKHTYKDKRTKQPRQDAQTFADLSALEE